MTLYAMCARLRLPIATGLLIALGSFLGPGSKTVLAEGPDQEDRAVTTYGLAFTNAQALHLVAEDLHVGPLEIRSDLRVRNKAGQPLTATATFPYPTIDLTRWDGANWDFPRTGGEEFLAFRVAVNGSAIPFRLERKAMHRGRDVTNLLRVARALPIAPWNGAPLAAQLATLPPVSIAELRRKGLLAEGPGGVLRPQWALSLSVVWNQFFRVEEEVQITLAYRPFITTAEADGSGVAEESMRQRYCIDGEDVTRLDDLAASAQHGRLVREALSFGIHSGGAWRGPTGRFRLTVHRDPPAARLFTCWPDLRPRGANTDAFEARDWIPDRDLDLLLVSPGGG